MYPIINTPQSRPANHMATGLVMVFLATMSTAVAYSGESIFDWDLAEAAAEPNSAPASQDGPDHATFGNILQDSEYDTESFWDRDQRWTENMETNDAPGPATSLQGSGSAPTEILFLSSISISELSFALIPLLLCGGLLLYRRNAQSSRIYSR